jgi:hypothetical protein
MKGHIISCFFFLIAIDAGAQTVIASGDTLSGYFTEVKTATKRFQNLWGKDIYGPMLLVDPHNRQLFANERDTAGILAPIANIYSGVLPANKNIANAAVTVGGKDWAMVILPLPKDKHLRIGLLVHELFHLAQPSLGFPRMNSENNHLDQKDGRIYLRLELEALKKAESSAFIF